MFTTLRVSNTLVCAKRYCTSAAKFDLHNILQDLKKQGTPDKEYSRHLLTHACSHGLDVHHVLGNQLVPQLVSCGNLTDATRVFIKLNSTESSCWHSLFCGFVQYGHLQSAACLYGIVPLDRSCLILPLLKACTKMKELDTGRRLHMNIVSRGLEQDLFIGSNLIDMYAKQSCISEAHLIFNKMEKRSAVSWNTLIAGYLDCEQFEGALSLFNEMQTDGFAADAVTFMTLMKVCQSLGDVNTGKETHTYIIVYGHEQELFVGSSVVSMYVRLGLLVEAWNTFEKLEVRDAVTWTTLLAGCAESGAGEQVLKYTDQMLQDGVVPTAYLYACIIKACSSIKIAVKGQELHMEIVKKGFEVDVYVGSSLVDMYAKCRFLLEAYEVLNKMAARNTVSWNALITGYSDHGSSQSALKCYEQMQLENVSPNETTLACVLKGCAALGAMEKGQEVHTQVLQKGLEDNVLVATSLVDFYGRLGLLTETEALFDRMTNRNVVSWNALLGLYAEKGDCEQAVVRYHEMKGKGVSPNTITFTCVLEACCGDEQHLEVAHEIHSEVVLHGYESDYYIGNVLVNLYAKAGELAGAQNIFDVLQAKSFESWTALITGYAEHHNAGEALKVFEKMKSECAFVDAVVLVCILKIYGASKMLEKCQKMHQEVIIRGYEEDPFLSITLIDVYSRCYSLLEAHTVFYALQQKNAIAWNTLISGYAEHGTSHVALDLYDEMQLKGVLPTVVTYASVLKACAKIGAIEKGREIHRELRQKGIETDTVLASALIDMYAVCGSISEAWRAFDKLPCKRDVSSWNAMLKGYGINNEGEMAISMFEEMKCSGVEPDSITFVCLLAACSRGSLVHKGQEYFRAMVTEYGISPTAEHLACMVDILARSGRLYQAEKLFESLPQIPSREMWTVLLTASKTHLEVELGEKCFQQLVLLGEDTAGPYKMMASIYASAGRWDDIERIEKAQKNLSRCKSAEVLG